MPDSREVSELHAQQYDEIEADQQRRSGLGAGGAANALLTTVSVGTCRSSIPARARVVCGMRRRWSGTRLIRPSVPGERDHSLV
jgi:hypothetical protein